MLKKHFNQILFTVTIIVAVIVIIITSFNTSAYHSLKDNNPLSTLNDDWYYNENNQIKQLTLPANLENGLTTMIMYHDFNNNEFANKYLLIRTSQQKIRVYLDDSLIYSFGYSDQKTGKSLGNAWNFIELPTFLDQNTLRIEISSNYVSNDSVINPIYVGTQIALLYHIFDTCGLGLIIAILIIIIGLVLLLFSFIVKRKRSPNEHILLFSLVALLIGFWILSETQILQLFWPSQMLNYYLPFISIALCPTAFLLYLESSDSHYQNSFTTSLVIIYCLNVFLMIGLQLFNLVDLFELLILTNVLIFIGILYVLISSIYYYITQAFVNRLFLVSIISLLLSSIVEGICFYYNSASPLGNFVSVGVLIFIVINTFDLINSTVTTLRDISRLDYFKKLATTDILTNLNNRTAYTNMIDQIRREKLDNIGIVSIDMNYLKLINDQLGHLIGDEALVNLGKVITKVYVHNCHCYRTGGDEFVVIINNATEKVLNELEQRFITTIANTNYEYKLNAAIGWTIFNRSNDKDIDEAICRADVLMYENKSKTKNKR